MSEAATRSASRPTTQSTTYCMGYWQVPENAKRPLGFRRPVVIVQANAPRDIDAGLRLVLAL